MCENKSICCNKLEAEPIINNKQLLDFTIISKDVKWEEYITPLALRSRPVYLQRQYNLITNYREPIGDHNRRKVLLCHDMMGNYLEDRHFHSSQKFDDYRFYHWSGIDYFCYFSHHYITIPPCGWINAAHKHGVPVLGTFITEFENGTKLLHEALASSIIVDRVVDMLLKLCKHYRFDGWLLNIECKVDPKYMENLHYFVRRLREVIEREVVSGSVFWYDSVVEGGFLSWQNEINDKNVRFFKSSNGAFVNYAWNEKSLEVTRAICERERVPYENVFFGVDVFGRGQIAKFRCKETLAHIVKYRFSTGIFAPGWTYETLKDYGYNIKEILGNNEVNDAFLMRNEKFWWLLWEHLATHPYLMLPFYTDFCLGSGKKTYTHGIPTTETTTITTTTETTATGKFFNLSRQSLQPSVPLYNLAARHYDDAFNGGSCLRIEQHNTSFRIFTTDFKMSRGGLVFAYAYKLDNRDGHLDCIVRFCTSNNSRDCHLFLGDYYGTISTRRGRCYISPFDPKYSQLLSGPLNCAQLPKENAFKTHAGNGWRVRYYVIEFDGAIQVKDIGVLYRKAAYAKDTAYLGAIYINEFNVDEYNFPADSNTAFIQVYGDDLLNYQTS